MTGNGSPAASSPGAWRLSDEERASIFAVEVLGVLHDMGKLTDGFVRTQAQEANPLVFRYKLVVNPAATYPQLAAAPPVVNHDELRRLQNRARQPGVAADEDAPYKLRDRTEELAGLTFRWGSEEYSLAELLPVTMPRYLGAPWGASMGGRKMAPAELVSLLHGVAHYEKESGVETGRQPFAATYRASAFGYEGDADGRVKTEARELTTLYGNLPAVPLATFHPGKWTAVRKRWLSETRSLMQQGLAQTARPTNEVTLWDWGWAVASLGKAAAASLLANGLAGRVDAGAVGAVQVRTVAVALDRLAAYSRADRITDLLGIQTALDDGYGRVRDLFEEEYAWGNQIYEDEHGAYFLLPAFELTADIRRRIMDCFPPDLQPQVVEGETIALGELDPQNGAPKVAALIANPHRTAAAANKQPVRPEQHAFDPHAFWQEAQRPPNAAICTVCGVRPVAYPYNQPAEGDNERIEVWAMAPKAYARSVCRVCLSRRGRRSQNWARSSLDGTVWADEVADGNGRLALIVGKLGLEGWLDGKLVGSLLVEEQQADKSIKLVSKNPSPARLNRIVSTAQAFWEEAQAYTRRAAEGAQRPRLAMTPTPGSTLDDLGSFHAYELLVGGAALPVVWDADGGRLLTAVNLDYFFTLWSPPDAQDRKAWDALEESARPAWFAQWLGGRTCPIQEPSGYDRPGDKRLELTVTSAKPIGTYAPVIPLLAEPGMSMALLPADKALDAAADIVARYETAFARVRDRLPLALGVVYFPRRTPMRAVLEAGRAMLAMNGEWEWQEWTVAQASASATDVTLTFDNGVSWCVPTVTGDTGVQNPWYANLLRKMPGDAAVVPADTVPARDLRQHSVVHVRPSRFDFEWLDTAGRRFDLRYNPQSQRRTRARPYLLEDLQRLETVWSTYARLDIAQRYQVVQAIEDAREAWRAAPDDPTFRAFVKDTLGGAAWPKGASWWPHLDSLINAAASGLLADAMELHMQILKERPSATTQTGKTQDSKVNDGARALAASQESQ